MLILVLLGSAGGVYAEPLRDGELKIAAPSAVLMEKETGELLYEKGAHERRPPASVTKVMTLLLIIEDIDIYCAGLNMTSEQEPFGIMPQILAISDKIINNYSSCNVCGRKAMYTYYDGSQKKESDVLVGDDGYKSLCRRCLKRTLTKTGDNRLTLSL